MSVSIVARKAAACSSENGRRKVVLGAGGITSITTAVGNRQLSKLLSASPSQLTTLGKGRSRSWNSDHGARLVTTRSERPGKNDIASAAPRQRASIRRFRFQRWRIPALSSSGCASSTSVNLGLGKGTFPCGASIMMSRPSSGWYFTGTPKKPATPNVSTTKPFSSQTDSAARRNPSILSSKQVQIWYSGGGSHWALEGCRSCRSRQAECEGTGPPPPARVPVGR